VTLSGNKEITLILTKNTVASEQPEPRTKLRNLIAHRQGEDLPANCLHQTNSNQEIDSTMNRAIAPLHVLPFEEANIMRALCRSSNPAITIGINESVRVALLI